MVRLLLAAAIFSHFIFLTPAIALRASCNPSDAGVLQLVLAPNDSTVDRIDFGALPFRTGQEPIEIGIVIQNCSRQTIAELTSGALNAPFAHGGQGNFPGAGHVGTVACTSVLESGRTCSASLKFSPNAPGELSGTLPLSYTLGGQQKTLTLQLRGVGERLPCDSASSDAVQVQSPSSTSPITFDFGEVVVGSTPTQKSVTLTNCSNEPVDALQASALNAPFSYAGAAAFPGITANAYLCRQTLAAGESCNFLAEFVPTQEGAASQPITVNYLQGNERRLEMQLAGRGRIIYLDVVKFSPEVPGLHHQFHATTIGVTLERWFRIQNTGGRETQLGPVAIRDAKFTYANDTQGTEERNLPPDTGLTILREKSTCGARLLPGRYCRVVVAFSPVQFDAANASKSVGAYSASLALPFSDDSGPKTLVLELAGTSRLPGALVISENDPFDMGVAPATGAPLKRRFVLQNTGGTPIRDLRPDALTEGFYFEGGTFPGVSPGCNTALLPAGARCAMVVSFSSAVVGRHRTVVRLRYNDGVAERTAVKSLVARGQKSCGSDTFTTPLVNSSTFDTYQGANRRTDVHYKFSSLRPMNTRGALWYSGIRETRIFVTNWAGTPTLTSASNALFVARAFCNGSHASTFNNGAPLFIELGNLNIMPPKGFFTEIPLEVSPGEFQNTGVFWMVAQDASNPQILHRWRILPTGKLDASFGNGGYSPEGMQTDPYEWSTDLSAIVPVAAEQLLFAKGGSRSSKVFRIHASGGVDGRFADRGVARLEIPQTLPGGSFSAGDVKVYPTIEGKFLVVASLQDQRTDFGDRKSYTQVGRFTAEGALDTSYQSGILRINPQSPLFEAQSLLMFAIPQPDGSALVFLGQRPIGAQNYSPIVVRLNPDGTRDMGFGTNGKKELPFMMGNLDAGANGSFLATAQRGITRLLANGDIDTSFGNNGYLELYDAPHGASYVHENADGRFWTIVNGTIRRYQSDGRLEHHGF